MKLTKNHLKLIVKECLVEILEEGIGSESSKITESKSRASNQKRQPASQARSRSLDNISWGDDKKVKNNNFEKNVNRVAKEMTSDPILSSILADTAKTTLQEQVERTGPGGVSMPSAAMAGDAAARATAASNPEDLFGGAAANWATLAFSDTPKK